MRKAIVNQSLTLCAVEKCYSPVKSKLVPLCCDHRLMIPASETGLMRSMALTCLDTSKDADTRQYAKEQLDGYVNAACIAIKCIEKYVELGLMADGQIASLSPSDMTFNLEIFKNKPVEKVTFTERQWGFLHGVEVIDNE